MAALEGYADLLRGVGNRVDVFICSAEEMKAQRMKAARYIFEQCKKGNDIPKDATFNSEDVDVSDIEQGRCYSGLLFVTSTARSYCDNGSLTASADAAHCEGVGMQSYETIFQIAGYDANHQLCPIVFSHFVSAESKESWL